ncbi:MAG: hypothetical protein FWE06_05660 [Oscillospiraceae bacterium]|nr:hypothetical protein [Oscillospiraceae bacterium]
MKKILKNGYWQLLLLFGVMMVLSFVLWAADVAFVPFNDWVFALLLASATVGITANAVRQREHKISYLPLLLPPMSGGVMTLFLLTVPMAFVIRIFLFLTMALCSMIVFFACTKRLQSWWHNAMVGAVYVIATMVVGVVIFAGTVLSWIYNYDMNNAMQVESPDGRFTAALGRTSDGLQVTLIDNGGIHLGVGRITYRQQRFLSGERASAFYAEAEWVEDDVLRVRHGWNWYYRLEGQRWVQERVR